MTTVANGFVQAFGDFDANGVLRYLADDAVIQLEATSREELPLLISFWKAMGYEQILDGACAVTGSHAAGTVVRETITWRSVATRASGSRSFT